MINLGPLGKTPGKYEMKDRGSLNGENLINPEMKKILDEMMFKVPLPKYCTDCQHFKADTTVLDSDATVYGHSCQHPIFKRQKVDHIWLLSETELKQLGYVLERIETCPIFLAKSMSRSARLSIEKEKMGSDKFVSTNEKVQKEYIQKDIIDSVSKLWKKGELSSIENKDGEQNEQE